MILLRSSLRGLSFRVATAGRRGMVSSTVSTSSRQQGVFVAIHLQKNLASVSSLASRISGSVHVPSVFTSSNDTIRSYSSTSRLYNSMDDDESVVVYESPFGSLVTRLRYVSLLTALAGSLGLPIVVALKGTVPTGGFLALCLSFGTGTWASTAAIHYVFKPYVFTIERIPVRKCHSPAKDDATTPKPPASQSYLYKAITRSLFLRRIETVFDPTTDVTKYTGLYLPLCNLVVRNDTPLFVHAESIYDNTLQESLPLGSGKRTRTTVRGTPARDNHEY